MYGSCRGIKRYKPNWGDEKVFKRALTARLSLFVIGINTGLKITELLSMKFEEVLNEDGTVKEFYSLPVKDEKFKQDIYLNTKVKEALLEYVQSIDVKRENYVFQSNKTKIQLHVNKRIVSFIMLLKRLGLLVKSEQTQWEKRLDFMHTKRDSDCTIAKAFSSRNAIRDAQVFRNLKRWRI